MAESKKRKCRHNWYPVEVCYILYDLQDEPKSVQEDPKIVGKIVDHVYWVCKKCGCYKITKTKKVRE